MSVQIELFLLVISLLFFFSILADKAGYKFGVPALLLFLAVGMLFGTDGLGIEFEDIYIAQNIGTIALCIILFSGGMDTKISEVRPVMAQGLTLATVGVLLTAFITGWIIWLILELINPDSGINFMTALLLAATMSSTDSASVFSILRAKGLHLKNNLRPMLELESGSNDPMAYILTVTLINILKDTSNVAPNMLSVLLSIIAQMLIGALMGFLIGKLIVWGINKLDINNASMYPILILTCCLFIFSATYFLRGNSYLAVYVGGIVIGNSKFVHKRSIMKFFDGLTWLCQLLMFLTLGLLVNPHELVPIIIPGLIVSFLMIFITRPLSVFISLAPFRRMSVREKGFVSWVGLRGAVPIIFSILILAADIPHARLIFNVVFFCTLVSLIVQGTSLPLMANLFGVAEMPKKERSPKYFDIELPEDAKSSIFEIIVNQNILNRGKLLMDLGMPDSTLVIMIRRNDMFFVPTGKTELKLNDKLLIITDTQQIPPCFT